MTSAYPTLEQMAKAAVGKIEYDEFLRLPAATRWSEERVQPSACRPPPFLPLINHPPPGGGTLRPSGIGSDR